METQRKTYYTTDRREQYKKRAFEADLLKLAVAIVAELLIFFVWFDGPARERYEILVHIALPICIVLPILNYRYLIVVPFIAFLPDVARAIGIDISHSLVILPLVFLAAFVPLYVGPRLHLSQATRLVLSGRVISLSTRVSMLLFKTSEDICGAIWCSMLSC